MGFIGACVETSGSLGEKVIKGATYLANDESSRRRCFDSKIRFGAGI